MLVRDFLKTARGRLAASYGEREAGAMVSFLCSRFLGHPEYFFVIEPDRILETEKQDCFEDCISRLCTGEPLQYILGETEFCGLVFKVTPSVLIPRPETELLCRMLLDEPVSAARKPLRILDLCTGSGCIAWTLAHYLPGSMVTGADLSEDALDVAASQTISGNAPDFIRLDVLAPQADVIGRLGTAVFDLIVSNPPYVQESEKRLMSANVLDHEPGMALFVPDEDPLLFYRAIAGISFSSLLPGGYGAVEINEAFGDETGRIFIDAGLEDVRVVKDLSDRDRFVFFRKGR